MKRSEINSAMRDAIKLLEEFRFALPPFAFWKKADWEKAGSEYDEIRDTMLGWDITDFGHGDFDKVGLLLFTIRNGSHEHSDKYSKTYAEKLLIVQQGQITPMHFHWKKMEDIINRGGGNLLIELYESTPEGEISDIDVSINTDGRNYKAKAGTVVTLKPGESITLPKGQYHKFWAENGPVIVGEVSLINDDNTDNRFAEQKDRFPTILEDEEPLYYLFSELPTAK